MPGQHVGDTTDRWNLFQGTDVFKPDSDEIRVEFSVKGEIARILMNESSRRGISYDEMAEILFTQGLYFWNQKQ